MNNEFDKNFRRAKVLKDILERYAEISAMDISGNGVIAHMRYITTNLLKKINELEFEIAIDSMGNLVAKRSHYIIFLT